MNDDARRHAPATLRNRDAILEVLERVLPPEGTVLEVASGTGEHAMYMSRHLAPRLWLPSDPDPACRGSIAAWASFEPSPNLVLPPLDLDAGWSRWPVEDTPPSPPITAIVAVNLVHIAPWEICLGLMGGAGRILPRGGVLYLYGAYRVGGRHTAKSNERFDQALRAQNPAWGVRDLEAVIAAAETAGLGLAETVTMPAENLSVVLHRLD